MGEGWIHLVGGGQVDLNRWHIKECPQALCPANVLEAVHAVGVVELGLDESAVDPPSDEKSLQHHGLDSIRSRLHLQKVQHGQIFGEEQNLLWVRSRCASMRVLLTPL